MAADTIESLTARYGDTYRWLVTSASLVGMMAMVLSSTAVSVAVPQVMGAFGVGQDLAQWMASSYFAAMTATMLLNAWLTQVFGRRAVFNATLIVFMTASIAGGFGTNIEIVILSRVLQGGCAGLIQPLAMSMVFVVFPPERRGTAMGLFGLGVVIAPALGPTLGGLAVDLFNWRYVFFLPVPLAFVAFVLGSIFLPGKQPGGTRSSFDWTGISLLCTALLCVLNGFASGQRLGWGSDSIVLMLTVGVLAVGGFIVWELNSKSPMLDLRLFGNAQFSSAFIVGFIFGFGMFGSIYSIAVFLQTVQGYTATRAGMLMLPAGFLMVVMFPIAGRLNDYVPAHVPILAGLVLFGIGFLMMADADVDTPFWSFVFFTLVNRAGLSLIIPSLNAGGLKALAPEQVPQGAGLINFTRMLGGAFGINLMVVLYEMRTAFYADALTATQTAANATSEALLARITGLLHAAGIPPTQQHGLALDFLGSVVHAQASALAFQDVFRAAAALAFLALIPAFVMGRSHRAARRSDAPAAAAPARPAR